jgi:UDP-GlcNAc:undecaprenyl-phosphate GlcNAc-1-phosphate transferase
MMIQLAAAITAFVISFLIVPVIIKYSLQKNLVDVPGRRKIHKKITPSMGGIAIFFGFFISSLIWIELADWKEVKFIMVALFIIFFIGVRDDLVPLRPWLKLVGQLLAAVILVSFFGLRLNSFYGLFGLHDIPIVASYVVTIFTLIIITNSFNLIDGLDGLAGTVALVSLISFGIWFYLIDDQLFAVFPFAMAGAILAFLFFNWEPSEVFMGDTGALVIGLTLAILAIHFIDTNYNLPAGHVYKFRSSVTTGICFIAIPLIDTLRIIILRLRKGQSPLTPDKSHIHHAILRLGKNHSQTTVILGLTQLVYIVIVVTFSELPERYLLTGVSVLSLLLSLLIDRLILNRLATKNQLPE